MAKRVKRVFQEEFYYQKEKNVLKNYYLSWKFIFHSIFIFFDRILSKIYYSIYTLIGTKKIVDKWNHEAMDKCRKENKPITILVHGIFANYYRTMYPTIKFLRKRDINVFSVGYDYKKDSFSQAKEIESKISEVIKKANAQKINIIGISLGGSVVRVYAELLSGKKYIDKMVTVLSPLKLKEESIARKMTIAISGNKIFAKDVAIFKKIEKNFSVKNYLAIYGIKDWILGDIFPISIKIKQIGIKGGHLFVSYNKEALKLAVRYIKGEKIEENPHIIIWN